LPLSFWLVVDLYLYSPFSKGRRLHRELPPHTITPMTGVHKVLSP
jgi:hypothetical protein